MDGKTVDRIAHHAKEFIESKTGIILLAFVATVHLAGLYLGRSDASISTPFDRSAAPIKHGEDYAAYSRCLQHASTAERSACMSGELKKFEKVAATTAQACSTSYSAPAEKPKQLVEDRRNNQAILDQERRRSLDEESFIVITPDYQRRPYLRSYERPHEFMPPPPPWHYYR